MEKCNGRFKGLPKNPKKGIASEFSKGRFSSGRGQVPRFGMPPLVMTEAAYVGTLWTLWKWEVLSEKEETATESQR